MSSTVDSDNQHRESSLDPEPHMSVKEQLALLETDLRMRHGQLLSITRPDLDDDPTPSPLEALKMYVGTGTALRLNRYLRGQRSGHGAALRRMHEGLLAYFEHHSRVLEAPLTMWRWVFTKDSYSPALLARRTIITERGWFSLTLDSFHGFFSPRADMECDVTLPVGTRVLSGSLAERELILRPGSTFRVRQMVDTHDEVDGKRKFLVSLDLLPE